MLRGHGTRPRAVRAGARRSKEITMLFLISWHGEPAQRDSAMRRFLQTGGQPPAGVNLLGRWHAVGAIKGVAIAECDDPALIGKWALEWNDLFEMDVSAALDDAQMGPLLAAQAAH
jgi:hypothetical protein